MTYKILIVDDSKLARMAIIRILTTLQPEWRRIEASNGDEAMALMSSEHPHITLLDFNMPGRDGLALAADLHVIDPHMPLAVISANSQEEIVARAREIGATFLPKPLSEQALAQFLSEAKVSLKDNVS